MLPVYSLVKLTWLKLPSNKQSVKVVKRYTEGKCPVTYESCTASIAGTSIAGSRWLQCEVVILLSDQQVAAFHCKCVFLVGRSLLQLR